jgi:hypothetical protein
VTEKETTLTTVTIAIAGKNYTFSLNNLTHKWDAIPLNAADDLEEGEFPLVGNAGGRRYELYSDGTFAEVEM